MLASGGMRTAFRLLSQAASHGRSIHIPSNALGRKLPLPPGGVSSAQGKGVLDTARNALTRLIYGANPIQKSNPHALRRAAHTTTRSVQNQFSFPVRHALTNSPMSFARPPVVPRKMTDVGLGTARKFSTGRPIFQHLAQNVPVAGRSMYEMDLDLQKRKARRIVAKKLALEDSSKSSNIVKSMESTLEENYKKYFPNQSIDGEEVSTVLTVPLVPFNAPAAPTSALYEETFLPMYETSNTFRTHGKHGQRVSTLFKKLDQASVWSRGAHYEAFGTASGNFAASPAQSALCTSLRIVFDGWTAAEVRNVIGESAIGWCVLQESMIKPTADREGPFSLESSRAPTPALPNIWDQTPEFVMPSIDFSSSFLEHRSPENPVQFEDISEFGSGPSTPWSENLSLPSTRPGSVFGDYEVDDDWRVADRETIRPAINAEPGVAFSAQFMRRSRGIQLWSDF